MSEPGIPLIPLCSAQELRNDYRDHLLDAATLRSPVDSEPLWNGLAETGLDALWSSDPPPQCAAFVSQLTTASPGARGIVLIAATPLREVAAELPATDPLATSLRRLLRGEAFRAAEHLWLAFDDSRRAGIGWVGRWGETARLLDRVARLANETLPILVSGETGTGKEIVARGIHVLGRRRDKPYLAVNCAELPESILESELFGHVRGSFTGATTDRAGLFEAAADGTVFLDEIGELPLAAQAKLLRLLEERQVRRIGSSQPRALACRIVAATNRDLATEISKGRFRADLYYRLRGFELVLRPLRERRGDILPLARFCAARAALRFRRGAVELGEDAKLALLSHAWPGNIRELRQTIEVAVLVAPGRYVDLGQLGFDPGVGVATEPTDDLLTVRAVERAHILRALASTTGNKMAAARILGLTRQSLQRRMLRHGIVPAPEPGASRPDPAAGIGPATTVHGMHSKQFR